MIDGAVGCLAFGWGRLSLRERWGEEVELVAMIPKVKRMTQDSE